LDQQLIGGGKALGELGFGAEAKDALRQRTDFLIDQELAEKRRRRVILTRNLLAMLRKRELTQAAHDIAAGTRLEHRPVTDRERVSGVYRRNVMLAGWPTPYSMTAWVAVWCRVSRSNSDRDNNSPRPCAAAGCHGGSDGSSALAFEPAQSAVQ